MRTVMALVTDVFLFLTAASLLVVGGAVFALFLFFPLFLLGLLGVMAGLEDRTVRQHDPSMSRREWRDGS
jgi:Sec-independent protein secretion pathway component TatC